MKYTTKQITIRKATNTIIYNILLLLVLFLSFKLEAVILFCFISDEEIESVEDEIDEASDNTLLALVDEDDSLLLETDVDVCEFSFAEETVVLDVGNANYRYLLHAKSCSSVHSVPKADLYRHNLR